MRHLVIGAGKMGRLHGKILTGMGDEVFYADIAHDFSPKHFRIRYSKNYKLDSILICTPPETHAETIAALAPFGVPLFCEKPLAVTQDELRALPELHITMVACNWRYCQCTTWHKVKTIKFGYKSKDKRPELDFIHFVDLLWDRFGRPLEGAAKEGRLIYLPSFKSKIDHPIEILFDQNVDMHYTQINDKKIHFNWVCRMFERQMEQWRETLQRKQGSPNPFKTAKERTLWLLDTIQNEQNGPAAPGKRGRKPTPQ